MDTRRVAVEDDRVAARRRARQCDVVLGGLSLGGGMALGHALERSHSMVGLVLLGSYGLMDRLGQGPMSRLAQLSSWVTVRSGVMSPLMRACARNPAVLQRSMRQLILDPDQLTPELLDEIRAAARSASALVPFAEWQRAEVKWNRLGTDYTEQLGAVSVPTLIVHGEHDTGVPVRCARIAAWRIPDARLVVVPGAAHWVQRDQPGVVLAALRDFIDELSNAAT